MGTRRSKVAQARHLLKAGGFALEPVYRYLLLEKLQEPTGNNPRLLQLARSRSVVFVV
jgi:hypothetical protein